MTQHTTNTPTNNNADELPQLIDKILENCVRDCADCILMFDTDDYAGKEAFKYRNQIMELFANYLPKAKVVEAIPKKIQYSRMAVEENDEFWLGKRVGFNMCRAEIRRKLGLESE